jgi:hypothetical protein
VKSLQWGIGVGVLWLLVAYNVAELYDVSAPHPWIALAAAIVAVGCVFGMRPRSISLPLALALPTAVYVAAKSVLVRAFLGEAHALGAAEFVITATALAAGVLALRYLETLQDVIGKVLGETAEGTLKPFLVGQDEIYREIRRARLYEKPLAVLAFSLDEHRTGPGLPFEEQVHQELMDKAAAASVAGLLARERTDCDVIVKHGLHLITALLAITREEVQTFTRKFVELAASQLGLRLRVGCAMFPEDGVTFEPLVRFAEAAAIASADDMDVAQPAALVARERARGLATPRAVDVRSEPVAAEAAARHMLVRAAAATGAGASAPLSSEPQTGSALGWSPLWRKRQ